MFEHSKYIARNKLLNGYQLSKLYTFEVAARHESFALAAEELSISPSAVSHRINQLEEELGFKLFPAISSPHWANARRRAGILGAKILSQLSQSRNS